MRSYRKPHRQLVADSRGLVLEPAYAMRQLPGRQSCGNRFCEQCGSPLEARCPSAIPLFDLGARFCGACGHRLPELDCHAQSTSVSEPPSSSPAHDYHSRLTAYTPKHLADKVLTSRSALEGERRQVTVLFADTAGFTTSSRKTRPRRCSPDP